MVLMVFSHFDTKIYVDVIQNMSSQIHRYPSQGQCKQVGLSVCANIVFHYQQSGYITKRVYVVDLFGVVFLLLSEFWHHGN